MRHSDLHTRDAYNQWAASYDTMENKTRDLEQQALQQTVQGLVQEAVLELGCGTGKNTGWLAQQAQSVVALDFSPQMLQLAQQKVAAAHVQFCQADLLQPWPVPQHHFRLISCSLVLEHIAQLEPVFAQAAQVLQPGGFFYVGELHPFRQYQGKGAHFQTSSGTTVAPANFNHHLSDYTQAAALAGFRIMALHEWFDTDDRSGTPRLVSFLFRIL